MTFKEIADMVDETGLPNAYHHFKKTGVAPPFICFFYGNNNDFTADDSNYQKIEHLYIELYTDSKDIDLEATVEMVLNSNGMVWNRDEDWIGSERLYEVVYEMDVVITEENNG